MTKVMVGGYGWVYVTIVIDWYTKKVVEHHAGEQSKAWHWLKALNAGLNRQFPDGVRGHALNLMSDNIFLAVFPLVRPCRAANQHH